MELLVFLVVEASFELLAERRCGAEELCRALVLVPRD